MRARSKKETLRRAVFPYVEQPSYTLGPIQIDAFKVLVLAAVITGFEIVVRRAPRFGLDREEAASVVAWTIAWGFVGSHVFDTLAYFPGLLRQDPLTLLKIWGSMSSFGGIFGGGLAAVVLTRRRGWSPRDRLRFVDCVGFAFPFAWIFGRAGCALAHDHPGIATDHWLAVRFPDGPRLDLGLLELLYTLLVAGLFLVLDRRPRPVGFFVGLFFVLYGPVRFTLDFFRTGDARYASLTPGQYMSMLAVVVGVAILLRTYRREPAPA